MRLAMAMLAGMRFEHYEILAPLGAGGMGEVYRPPARRRLSVQASVSERRIT
jgi:hypothetical protein